MVIDGYYIIYYIIRTRTYERVPIIAIMKIHYLKHFLY